jgi:hypothetical protein
LAGGGLVVGRLTLDYPGTPRYRQYLVEPVEKTGTWMSDRPVWAQSQDVELWEEGAR